MARRRNDELIPVNALDERLSQILEGYLHSALADGVLNAFTPAGRSGVVGPIRGPALGCARQEAFIRRNRLDKEDQAVNEGLVNPDVSSRR